MYFLKSYQKKNPVACLVTFAKKNYEIEHHNVLNTQLDIKNQASKKLECTFMYNNEEEKLVIPQICSGPC